MALQQTRAAVVFQTSHIHTWLPLLFIRLGMLEMISSDWPFLFTSLWRSPNIFLQLFEVSNITDVGSPLGLLQLLCWFFSCMIRFIESCLSLLCLVKQRAFIFGFSQQTWTNRNYNKKCVKRVIKTIWGLIARGCAHWSFVFTSH